MSEYLDITQKLIHSVFKIPKSKNLDLRIALALLEKAIVFLLFFFIGGEERFSFFDYGLSLIGWLIMHVQIICSEMDYLKNGNNDLMKRYVAFKIADFCQMAIVVAYFAASIHIYDLVSPLNSFMLYATFMDQGMNMAQFFQLSNVEFPKNQRQVNYQGGFSIFIIGIFIGSCFSYYIAWRLLQYSQHLKDQYFPFYPAMLWCGMVGELAFMGFSFLYYTRESKSITPSTAPKSGYKYLLCFSYGLCIGVFNIYYAMILGIYCLIKIAQYLYEIYKYCRNSDQVHP